MPHFKMLYQVQDDKPRILGKFTFRGIDSGKPEVSKFMSWTEFQFDTGSSLTLVSEKFAQLQGFAGSQDWDSYLRQFPEIPVDGVGSTCKARVITRDVQFTDYISDKSNREIERYTFKLSIAVAIGVKLETPLLGLHDFHRYFSIGREGDEYWCMFDDDQVEGISRI